MLFASIGAEKFSNLTLLHANNGTKKYMPGLANSSVDRPLAESGEPDATQLFVRVKVTTAVRPELEVQAGLRLPSDGVAYLFPPVIDPWNLALREMYMLVKVSSSSVAFGFGAKTDMTFPASVLPKVVSDLLDATPESTEPKVISATGELQLDSTGVVAVKFRSDTEYVVPVPGTHTYVMVPIVTRSSLG